MVERYSRPLTAAERRLLAARRRRLAQARRDEVRVMVALAGVLLGRQWARRIAAVDAALQRGTADVVRARATGVVEFEEEEDEGALYAFQTGPDEILIVAGQDCYASPKFPREEFEFVMAPEL